MIKTLIYGAQGYALGVYKAIKYLHPKKDILGFVVTEMGNNASSLGGMPVTIIEDFASTHKWEDCEFYIATPTTVQDEIVTTLKKYAYTNYILVDDDYWAKLMAEYYSATKELVPLASLPSGATKPSIKNYVACSNFDKELKEKYAWPDFSIPIHLGKPGKDSFNATVLDSTENNISHKNPNYCELTALYWLWKNDIANTNQSSDYYGLCHYRRFLTLTDEDLTKLVQNDIDAVLPFPLLYEPDIQEHRKRYIKDVDWSALLKALKELHPEIMPLANKVLAQEKLFNYNVILAKREVLNDYCNWLFPILERVEELSVPKGSERADRYIGYMGETLETVYFMMNADKYNIVHAGCKLLE